MLRYETLVGMLDKIREEAPEGYRSYHPDISDTEALSLARSKAFIHLFLKVKCGMSKFRERHEFITEGTQDGGVDAFFLDTENKRLFLIQSKFRTTGVNFECRSLTADDLVRMEIRRILRGCRKDSRGNEFNSKIKVFQNLWAGIPDHANYKCRVIILGNIHNYSNSQIERLVDNMDFEIFDFEKTYKGLVLPLCTGTYYEPKEITIKINLGEEEQQKYLIQTIVTTSGHYDVIIIFVPTEELARVMSIYKNSLLKYNPRNYLTLSKNVVNKTIKESIINTEGNDFAIFNNGVTVLSEDFCITELTGKKDIGQLILRNPQIINGGQTAHTLSEVYEESTGKTNIFENKEVLLKAIKLKSKDDWDLHFIEEISNATNKQTAVKEEDRRSNDEMQVKLQESIYDEFGYYYERKQGEFFDGIKNHYISKNLVINRRAFLKAHCAFKGAPSLARSSSNEKLFREDNFKKILDSPENYRKMFFSWLLFDLLLDIEKEERKKKWKDFKDFKKINFGYALRYGKMAVIASVGFVGIEEKKLNENEIYEYSRIKIKEVLKQWRKFEKSIIRKPGNIDYFGKEKDFDNYYKGKTVDSDVKECFSKS
jgi:hypothetical protein